MQLFRLIVLIISLGYLTGCAYGKKVDYSEVYPRVTAKPSKPVEVLVLDERAYVLNGSKEPSYVGLIRGSYYIPYDVNTRSGEPLAKDLQSSLIGGVTRSGGKAEPARSVVMQASNPDRQLLVVRIKEWKSEAFMGTVLTYVLAVDVYDEAGKRLASSPVSGSEGVSDYTVSGKNILTRLLADSGIATALAGSTLAVEAPAAKVPEARRAPMQLFTPAIMRDGVF